MNLTRVLNVALPEIPARSFADRPPRRPPDAVFKEHTEDGCPVVRVLVASQDAMYRFSPENWALIELFNGQRTYEEIAELYSQQLGSEYSVEEVREFVASLESLDFWYKTPQEKNIHLMQQSASERQKLLKSRKSKFGDLSEITFPAVNPDKFLTWLYSHTSFVYTWWFTLASVIAIGITIGISAAHWTEIGRDTAEFFNFKDKSWSDFGVFYILALITLCWHELAHGHACKHYGGRVPAMGFMLVYLTPAFYTDTGEGFVKGTRPQRLIIAMAGAWSELLICAVATPIWWGTPPGSGVHDAAYQLMLMTGIAGLLINWNPLMKLDGYHMLCEIVGIAGLKETSTAYVSAWVKRHIWRLPVEVPYVPKRRRLGFAAYALVSGAYSYMVLYIVARFVGNVFRNFNPEWSFVPELATAGLIFRSRIRTLVNFMKFVYLDKKDRLHAWLKTPRAWAIGATVLAFLILPVWHDSITGRFTLEPGRRMVVRANVPGIVSEVNAREGLEVAPGRKLFQIKNISLESKEAEADTNLKIASLHAASAELHHTRLGDALEERERFSRQKQILDAEIGAMEIASPIQGTVLTPRVEDRLNAYLTAGSDLVEIGDLKVMRARIYVSEHDVQAFHSEAPAQLEVDGVYGKWKSTAARIAQVSTEVDPSMAENVKYKGLNPPQYYLVDLYIANTGGRLKPGMRGFARIYGTRRSLLGFGWEDVARFWGRKAW